ncbi:MAG: hypothetical protein FWG74_09610, partial [Planctomycetes bacterium]|nr:hypothetical protein [Planctomycetota bacterium]
MGIPFHVLEITFTPEPEQLLAKLALDADSSEAEDFLALLERAAPLAQPRAAIGTVRVDSREDSGRVVLGGVEFSSALLAKNFAGAETVWPYIASCGRELYDFVMAIADPFERFWGDAIMQQALTDVRAALDSHLAENIYSGKTAYMGPGQLPEWPIAQQVPLFKLLGEA